MNYLLTTKKLLLRDMDVKDVPLLRLEEEWMYQRFVQALSSDSSAAFIVEDESPICAFGALFEWENHDAAEVWFNIIKKTNVYDAIKMIKRSIPLLAKDYQVKRMQAIIQCDKKEHVRFIEFMGFRNETPFGMKKKLYNGKDAYLFAKVF